MSDGTLHAIQTVVLTLAILYLLRYLWGQV